LSIESLFAAVQWIFGAYSNSKRAARSSGVWNLLTSPRIIMGNDVSWKCPLRCVQALWAVMRREGNANP